MGTEVIRLDRKAKEEVLLPKVFIPNYVLEVIGISLGSPLGGHKLIQNWHSFCGGSFGSNTDYGKPG